MAPRAVLKSSIAVCVAALIAAGCGSASRNSGGYYLDDGPGGRPPIDLDRVPDATPRAEPIKQATTRPYTVLGRTYLPFAAPQPYRARGVASWYGKRYHGQSTATGEIYDMYAMTAAHTVLPLPSYAKVTNLSNGRSVIVRVNDRGPFLEERIIDLSYVAAYKLGFINDGSTMVEVEAILPGDTAAPSAPVILATEPPPRAGSLETGESGFFLQLGAFSLRDNAQAFAHRMRSDATWMGDSIHLYKSANLYRVHAGPYDSRAAADRDASRVYRMLGISPLVIDR
ncbi:MAG TPA: septal ring lytic transglycosylase RlpA family protein [Burkholderiales bacterium]|nr:septal ring lytic transglycosylase RlpA family protein [Burkholderiales bacterium]